MNEIVRNLIRRKLRSFLTISGIVIGIVALTTMGALANNFNALLDGGAKYFAGFVPVGDASSRPGHSRATNSIRRLVMSFDLARSRSMPASATRATAVSSSAIETTGGVPVIIRAIPAAGV